MSRNIKSVETPKALRELLRSRDIADSISAFARMLKNPSDRPYGRQSIYRALKNPTRYPLLSRRINKIINQ